MAHLHSYNSFYILLMIFFWEVKELRGKPTFESHHAAQLHTPTVRERVKFQTTQHDQRF